MVAAPLNFRGDLKISDKLSGGEPEQKINFFFRGAKFKGGRKILGWGYEHTW